MIRTRLISAIVLGVWAIGATFAQSPVEQASSTTSPHHSPSEQPTLEQERQRKIREHNERIRRIIAESNARREQQRNESKEYHLSMMPGWIVRVAEGLIWSEKDRLLRQLELDGFSPMAVIAAPPLSGRSLKGVEFYDVLLHFKEDKNAAIAAEKKLRDLGYQFGSVRFGRLLDEITAPEPDIDSSQTTDTQTSPTIGQIGSPPSPE